MNRLYYSEVITMRRLFTSGLVLLAALLALNLLFLTHAGADENWQMGNLAYAARRLGVQPGVDGKYDVASLFQAIIDRLPTLCVVQILDPPVVYQGDKATLRVNAFPNAYCEIEVYLPSGRRSEADGLGLKKEAGANGIVSWTWLVDREATPGTGHIVVTAVVGSQRCKDTEEWQVLAR